MLFDCKKVTQCLVQFNAYCLAFITKAKQLLERKKQPGSTRVTQVLI